MSQLILIIMVFLYLISYKNKYYLLSDVNYLIKVIFIVKYFKNI